MILLTGGAGYIGSHMLVELLNANHQVVVLDNLCNSSEEALNRVQVITKKTPEFVQGDIRDTDLLDQIFDEYQFHAVLHFAGLKAVAESVVNPQLYFDNNIVGSLCLFDSMQKANVNKLVFSSSATVYGNPIELPITEDTPISMPKNPYGYTKLVIEQMLMQIVAAKSNWRVAALRYFNPIGAHVSGLIGENPRGIPNNLMPYISQVAAGKLDRLCIFGNDYDTSDGTGVRDYIHVMDLVNGHLKALNYLNKHTGFHVWNLGTGKGNSVLDMVNAFENITGCDIPYVIKPRRQGDIASCYADPNKAKKELKWQCQLNLNSMIKDAWRWQQKNPNGYSN